jgi:general secretion pathway protein M
VKQRPADRLQPVLALGLLLAVLAAVAALAILPIRQAYDGYDAAIAAAQQRLAVQRGVAAATAGLEPRLAQLERGYATDASYLKSTSRTLAAAELQGIVKRAILAGRGEVLSTQIVNEGGDNPGRGVTLAVKMRATVEQTVGIFYRLETGQPLLFIDDVQLRTQVVRLRRPDAQPAAPPLDVQFELTGFLRGDLA